MLSKTRTTMITLIAALSFAGTAIVPTVAQARKKKPSAAQQHCEYLGREFDFWEQQYNTDALNHESKKVLEHDIAEANGYFEEARLYGCGWTGHVQPGSLGPTAGLRPGGEPKSLTPPSSPPPVRVIAAPLPLAGALV